MTELRVLLPARLIPVGAKVTKRTGEKPYKVVDSINFYGNDDFPSQKVKVENGVRFLASDDGNINVVSGETELLAFVDTLDLATFLDTGRFER